MRKSRGGSRVRFTAGVSWFGAVVAAALFLLAHPGAAQAATLSLSPSSGSYAIGKTFTVSVIVSSPNQALNAVSGQLSFHTDLLTATSVSKSGSIMSLWVQEPAISSGTVSFEGVVLNPGYTGSGGRVVAVTFKVKATGSATLRITAASVLANDGKGTNILDDIGSATFNLGGVQPSVPEASSPVAAPGLPPAPHVTSATHPDPNAWYAVSDATFSWANPPGTTGVNVLADHNPTTDPGTRSDGLVTSWIYHNIDDGIWYFHIRLRNAKGWGAVSHFRFQIDTQKPEPFTIKLVDGRSTSNPTPTALFDTTDVPSGIDYYKVKVGEGEFTRVSPEVLLAGNPYTLPPQPPGKHTILVQAFDKAGNYTTDTQEFEIMPLDRPKLTDYPRELAPGDALVVKGETYSSVTVRLTLVPVNNGASWQETMSDERGRFILTWPHELSSGTYQFTVQAIDKRGAKSLPTDPATLYVREAALLRAGRQAINYLSVLVALVALIVGIMISLWYGLAKLKHLRRRLRAEVTGAERTLHRSFSELRGEVKDLLKLIELARTKRELTLEEAKIAKQLQRALDAAEKVVGKEIEEIEREVDT